MSRVPEIVMVAEATAEHPRHGGLDMIELKDGGIFMAKMEITAGKDLRHAADDEAPSDIIGIASHDGGRTWGERRRLITTGPGDKAAYYPGLLRLRDGSILFRHAMFHKFVYGQPWSLSGYVCFSKDECKTFSDTVTVLDKSHDLAWSCGDLLLMSTGRIVIPTQKCLNYELQDDGGDHCLNVIQYSDDNGLTWKVGNGFVDLPMRGAMEPKIEELKDGRLLMIMRSQLGAVFQALSEDGGLTWSKPQTTSLRAPESCPGLRRIPQTGHLLIVWNNALFDPSFDHSGLRNPLTVAISKDEGRTWEKAKDVDTGHDWEFTNPSIMVTSDGHVLIAYEASKYDSLTEPGYGNVGQIGRVGRTRMHLKLAIIPVDWLYT